MECSACSFGFIFLFEMVGVYLFFFVVFFLCFFQFTRTKGEKVAQQHREDTGKIQDSKYHCF